MYRTVPAFLSQQNERKQIIVQNVPVTWPKYWPRSDGEYSERIFDHGVGFRLILQTTIAHTDNVFLPYNTCPTFTPVVDTPCINSTEFTTVHKVTQQLILYTTQISQEVLPNYGELKQPIANLAKQAHYCPRVVELRNRKIYTPSKYTIRCWLVEPP